MSNNSPFYLKTVCIALQSMRRWPVVHHVRCCSASFKHAEVGRCWQERQEPTYSSCSSMQVWQWQLKLTLFHC